MIRSDIADWTEKRKYRRVPVCFHLRYSPEGARETEVSVGEEERQASIVNISEGGLAILTDRAVPEMTKLDLRFDLSRQDKTVSSISAVGQVCHNLPLLDRSRFHVGIEFIMIKDADRERIAQFVRLR